MTPLPAATRCRSRAARPRRAGAQAALRDPVALGLLDAVGRELPLTPGSASCSPSQPVAGVRRRRPNRALVLRGFSAPVVLECDYSDAQLLTLLANDSDPFNRWEAGQRLALRRALAAIAAPGAVDAPLDAAFIEAMRAVLRHERLDAAFKELALTLPSETYIAEQLEVVDPQRVHAVREGMREELAQALQADWAWAYEAHKDNGAYRPDPLSAGRRALAGLALAMLCCRTRHSSDAVWPARPTSDSRTPAT